MLIEALEKEKQQIRQAGVKKDLKRGVKKGSYLQHARCSTKFSSGVWGKRQCLYATGCATAR